MNEFLEILYLVSNEELKLVLLEELSDQRAKRKYIFLYIFCSCKEYVQGWLSRVYQKVGSGSEIETIWQREVASEFLILAV